MLARLVQLHVGQRRSYCPTRRQLPEYRLAPPLPLGVGLTHQPGNHALLL
jgi:hypothetical protein